jgi:fumarate hydratase class II
MSAAVRIERDSLGVVNVNSGRLWGAQTQRSLDNFQISDEKLPKRLLWALALVKQAAAETNASLGILEPACAGAIALAAQEVMAGKWVDEFPLSLWQTGSGTQSHMNMNEVLANRASEILGGKRGEGRRVHPNDHVNLGQSTNDVFSAAMALAASAELQLALLPKVTALRNALAAKSEAYADLVKVGRTHLQDATPLTLGQEMSGWVSQLDHGLAHVRETLPHLGELALGGTAVGTGLNAALGYAEAVAQRVGELSRLPLLVSAPNKFEAMAAHDALVFGHGALKTLAASLMKIANDIRWLASGPHCGIGELKLPNNEPGSSMMPGKANPTQCEALMMCCAQVFGNDVTINVAGMGGNLQLNTFKPVLVSNFLQSARLLGDGADSFQRHLVLGLEPDRVRISLLVHNSLMLVTALVPSLGYDRAAEIALRAKQGGLSLRDAAIETGFVTAADFDALVQAGNMT